MPTTTSPLTTPRSGFVQPTFRSVIVESFLCVSGLLQITYNIYNARRKTGRTSWDLRCPFLVKKLSFAKPTPICGVHLQQANCRSANRTATDNKHAVAFEVLIPPVLPRMKQPDERAAFRIKSTQVRSLVRIAVVAGESEVFAVASSAMLGFARFLRF